MPGPPPKPTEAKRLAGNPGHQRLAEPIFVIEGSIDHIPEPPGHLGADGAQRWREVWGEADRWLVAGLDRGLLVRYCEGWDRRAVLTTELGRRFFVKGSMGQRRVNPALDKLDVLDAALGRMENDLGLSPTSRARLHVEKRPAAPKRKLDAYRRSTG